VTTDTETVIQAAGNRLYGYKSLVAAVNPATGKSVVYEWTGHQDITVTMVDTDPSSPTFNTVIRTLAGNLGSDFYVPYSGAATPDGKYVYVNVFDSSTGVYTIDVFDVVHGGNPVVLSADTLNVAPVQFNMYVSPDGKSLLLNFDAANGAEGIMVFDIGNNPLNPTPVTTIVGNDDPYVGLLYSFVISGNRLYAYDYIDASVPNVVWIYNFDRQHNNYSVLGYAQEQGSTYGNKVIAVSPDDNFLFVAGDEAISIFNANQIVNGQAPLITQLASYHGPAVLGVSPMPGQNLIGPFAAGLHRENPPQQVQEEKPVTEAGRGARRPEQIQYNTKNPRFPLEP
jgi:hypothetical protein